jgi:hypothetical protein
MQVYKPCFPCFIIFLYVLLYVLLYLLIYLVFVSQQKGLTRQGKKRKCVPRLNDGSWYTPSFGTGTSVSSLLVLLAMTLIATQSHTLTLPKVIPEVVSWTGDGGGGGDHHPTPPYPTTLHHPHRQSSPGRACPGVHTVLGGRMLGVRLVVVLLLLVVRVVVCGRGL